MTPASVKEKLHEYIEHADEKKIQAIYTLIESEIEDNSSIYDETVLEKFRATSEGYLSGKVKGYSMEESLQRIRQQLTKK